MKTVKLFALSMLVFIGLASCSSDDDNTPTPVVANYSGTLNQLNNSGASGMVNIIVDNNKMTVSVTATGMVPNQPHPQHIHGKDDGSNATCPPTSADTDGDGIITIPEGAPFYGAVLLPLEDFPMADANGNVNYTKTFTLGENGVLTLEALGTLENRTIVLHGLNNGGSYVATIPVACGEITKI
ncbi:hypothetical protein Aeqsu_3172 [Aequorivita sublithincola DSM 14238]|uniref:CHRD domain-containing protein n=1 Tax=Aequorivita sublithincola (strain DSM 14238 / LMG 21431 / ACAM 643 / 9-3) TaxID=746697 RepID=I3Z037_AEQSU|nr:hypothetical protein [Aequorivita sublithincola]AFL82605.1 hypothetical protein Aeqsu_3172 [Aequorivita sublithincola DSM 14238]